VESHRSEFVSRRQVPVLVPGCAHECARVCGRQTGCAVDRRNEGGIFRARSDVCRGVRHPGEFRRTPVTSRRVPAGSTRTVREFEVVTGIGEGNPAAKTICVVVIDRSAAWTGGVRPRSDPIRLDRSAWSDRQSRRTDEDNEHRPARSSGSPRSIDVSDPTTEHELKIISVQKLNVPMIQISLIILLAWPRRPLTHQSVATVREARRWTPSERQQWNSC
jgi:hypothetical protein